MSSEVKAIRKIIQKWSISQSVLAQKIGMPPTTFSGKLKGVKPYHKFNREEVGKLKDALQEVVNDVKAVV